jgi:PhnB protein
MTKPYRPKGFSDVTPYLIVVDADRLIAFIRNVFNAEEVVCFRGDDGRINHAAFKIGNAMVELSEARDPWKPMTAGLHVYVENVDEVYQKALDAGAVSLYEPADMFYGERSGGVADPEGNHWYLAAVTEELSLAEIQKRSSERE